MSDDYRYRNLRAVVTERLMAFAGWDRLDADHASEFDADDPGSQYSVLSEYATVAVEAVVSTLFRWQEMLTAPYEPPTDEGVES